MKKVGLGLSLTVLALGFLVSPALAASPPPAARALSAADQAFLASLAASTPAPSAAAKRPRIGLEKASCTANCWNGNTVSCQGSSCSAVDSNCSAGQRGSVTCDGATTSCPVCPCNLDCTALQAQCKAQCDLICCKTHFTCSLTTCTTSCSCGPICMVECGGQ